MEMVMGTFSMLEAVTLSCVILVVELLFVFVSCDFQLTKRQKNPWDLGRR